jgi:hypothetical protein
MTRSLLATLIAMALTSACSKDEPPTPAAPSAAVSVAPPLPSVTASAIPSAVASAAPSAAPVPSTTTSSSGAKPAATCGDKPLPACPLAAWMKSNTSPAMTSQDFGALATALEKIVNFAPAGYTNWVSISRDGADAARAQSLDGVKASCRGCHNQYKDRYRKEMRDRPI